MGAINGELTTDNRQLLLSTKQPLPKAFLFSVPASEVSRQLFDNMTGSTMNLSESLFIDPAGLLKAGHLLIGAFVEGGYVEELCDVDELEENLVSMTLVEEVNEFLFVYQHDFCGKNRHFCGW